MTPQNRKDKKMQNQMTKNDKKMTKINNQQPSEFAGKIFIILPSIKHGSGNLIKTFSIVKIAKLNGGFSGLPTLTPSTLNSSWWLLLLSLDSIAGKKHRYQGICACHMFSHRTMCGSILSKEV